jgi:hypothetical protein
MGVFYFFKLSAGMDTFLNKVKSSRLNTLPLIIAYEQIIFLKYSTNLYWKSTPTWNISLIKIIAIYS